VLNRWFSHVPVLHPLDDIERMEQSDLSEGEDESGNSESTGDSTTGIFLKVSRSTNITRTSIDNY
jgi:hypothetical protein